MTDFTEKSDAPDSTCPEEPKAEREPPQEQSAVPAAPRKPEKNGYRLAVIALSFALAAFLLVAGCSGILLAVHSAANNPLLTPSAPSVSQPGTPSSQAQTPSAPQGGASGSDAANPDAPQLELNGLPQGSDALSASQIVKKVQPSVVTVVAYEVSALTPVETGEGSGVVISADGYVLTNAHVVLNSKETLVVLIDASGKSYDAYVVGYDERTDLAVLKTKKDDVSLVPAEFGDSTTVYAGDSVLVIGNPGGAQYAGSVTMGVVSATDRVVNGGSSSFALIQTDAAINPGNSGGALVNSYGQVIGITSSKIVSTSYEGMGFAIPVTSAQKTINDLLTYGGVQNRVRLGINYSAVSAVASVFYDWPQGVQITAISSDSVFLGAGIKVKDIITKVGDKEIRSAPDLYAALDAYMPGDTVSVTVYRSSQEKTFTVEVTLVADNG